MNILLVAEYYFANPDLVRLSTELVERKHSVSVATSFRSFDRREVPKGVDVFEVHPFITIHSVPHSLSLPYAEIYRHVLQREIDIIHALMDYSTNTAVASLVSKKTGVPFVYNVQGMGTRTGRFVVDVLAEFYDWTIERFISGNSKKLIILSRSLISRTRKLGVEDSRVAVIPSGVDPLWYDPGRPDVKRKADQLRADFGIDSDHVVIGFVGRLVPAKGLSHLLVATKKIQAEFPNVVLLIVGDGPQKTQLQRMAKELNLRTTFTGYQNDTPPYYALMDVFILPSLFEGLPGVVLEAMAMEKAVIATNVGGTADLVVNGENGFLIPASDAERIAVNLRKLISDEGLRTNMGKVGRKIVQKGFLWDDIADKVETVYKEVT